MNKKVLIVTGASRGIGKAIVDLLSSNPDVYVLALSRDLPTMQKAFGNYSNVSSYAFDLSVNVQQQLESILQNYPTIDFVINNAGLLINKDFTKLTSTDLQLSYQVNVIGVMETVQALVPKMKQNGGHIVNISSMGGFQGSMKFPGLAAYSTSKAALCSFTELFAEEYKESEIKMNCLCLGATQTEMLQQAFPGFEAPMSASQMAEFIMHFTLNDHKWMHGKIIPVSLSTP